MWEPGAPGLERCRCCQEPLVRLSVRLGRDQIQTEVLLQERRPNQSSLQTSLLLLEVLQNDAPPLHSNRSPRLLHDARKLRIQRHLAKSHLTGPR